MLPARSGSLIFSNLEVAVFMDTIAAIATGTVQTAIGIIRISGEDAILAADAVFRASSGVKMQDAEPRKLVYGELLDATGEVIDRCLCTCSHAPHSYTGENTAELQCHGSPAVLRAALEALFSVGVRQAQAGEFTKRAFLNGCMDLTQAEAVIDLISAETAAAAKNAAGQLGRAISSKTDAIYDELVNIMSHYHAVIDYPDEDVEEFELANYLAVIEDSISSLSRLAATFERGKILKEGIPATIIGRPNAGKSSLLNSLLGYDRAIVTDIAGTTRDTIEEKVRLGDVILRLSDTAGMRESDDVVERIGIERAAAAANSSELVIAVFDGTQPLAEEDRLVLETAARAARKIAVINKSDMDIVINMDEIESRIGETVIISAVTGAGIEELGAAIETMFADKSATPIGELITNARQAEAVLRALSALQNTRSAMLDGVTPDAVLTAAEDAANALGELSGKTLRDDVVSRIFERFCVGK